MLRKPYLSVSGPLGDIVPGLGSTLIGVEITDQGGYESDECIIMLRRRPPFAAPPAKGTRYSVRAGWSAAGAVMTGSYSLERVQFSGTPEEGHEMQLVCRAADFIDKMKAVDSEHFDAENGHKTYGDVINTLAGRAGVPAVIAGDIAGIALPKGYTLRWQQSAIDFLTDIGDDLGAVVKPQAGKLVVRPRGVGQSGSGQALSTIVIPFDPNYGYEVDIEPRPAFAEVAMNWFDGGKGLIQEALAQTSQQFSRLGLPHPFPDEASAKRGAAAAGQEFNRAQGTGSFEMAGEANAVAEAKVVTSGFGPGIDDVKWIASSVTHSILAEDGWTTTVATQTEEKA